MWRITIILIFALALAMQVQAKSENQIKHEPSQEITKERLDIDRHEVFSPAERNLIRAQLLGQKPATSQKNHKDLPPGLQKKVARGKTLPPGWQKKVAPGQSLDYHIYRQGESLPAVLLRRLPPSPVGSEILQIENKIVRLNSATRTILDIFDLTPTR